MIIFLIIGLLLGASVIIFAAQNITTVAVTFLSWHFEGSLALILVLAVVAGMVISSFLSMPTVIQKYFQISRLKKTNNQLKEELGNKEVEVQEEKSKVAATNAYLDTIEKPRI